MSKLRARALGLPFPGMTGPNNAITDVPGIQVGFKTLMNNDPISPARTGVTAILPRGRNTTPQPVWAGMYALNGNGEMTGTHWIQDGGYFVGPIMLTNSHAVGITHHAAVKWTIKQYQQAWQNNHLWAMPVVAETYDGVLNDINAMHVSEQDALDALNNAKSGAISEGNVGGGTGMIAYDFKGGTGTSSRLINIAGETYTVAALVQANHGIRPWFTVLGAPVGKLMTQDCIHPLHEQGSIIVILATDAPMLPHQLKRLAKRAALGIGKNGSPGGNNSGDIFLAFSTANEQDLPQLSGPLTSMTCLNDEFFDAFYMAAVEAIEESVINAMVAAEDTPTFKQPNDKICKAVDVQSLSNIVKTFHSLP
ncbi:MULTISPECIES: P1 family peptidase [Marinomonas]|uniref:L-aminopeptidase DmpA n=2 Tax=Marinomonas TaxID=28253 RepID=A0A366D7X2_9GAMM|nr:MULTISPECIES: P1 family peptidase [Marinomonas]AEF53302.1 peptidase S58 DmpA [Marinomonas posidonica IVIA-Po-181]RBO86045.1 L-aminopeptidase DmpA [Marinomonas aquiplantarum]